MRLSFAIFALILFGATSEPGAQAGGINIEKVIGEAWYGSSAATAGTLLKSNTEIQPGFLRTGADGSLYGTAGQGSKFRIGPGSAMEIEGTDEGTAPCGIRDALRLKLLQGKLTIFSVAGASGYEVQVRGGRICIPAALCVLCMHGDAAHIYVARGQVTLFPLRGAFHAGGLLMKARPTIAALSEDGSLEIQPLSHSAPGISSCLLSGVTPEIAAHIQEGSPNPANIPGNAPVSEIQ